MTSVGQLALPFTHQPHFTRADFLAAGSNEDARTWLSRTAQWPQHRLALWGEGGCGKTHLLHIWASEHDAEILAGPRLGSTIHPTGGAVAIDAADACPEPRVLLHLLNQASEAGCAVLLAARRPPARWPTALPDLASRLRAIVAVQIAPPEDAMLRSLLARLLAQRQVWVPEAVQDWLLLRLPRTAAVVREAANRLDRQGLERGIAIGRSLAADVLDELRNDPEFQESFESTDADLSRGAPSIL